MAEQREGFSKASFILGIAFLSVGLFPLGNVIGSVTFSDTFSFDQISLLQVGLICSGVFGYYLFLSNLKKLKTLQGSNIK